MPLHPPAAAARHIASLTPPLARAVFGDRIARAFLLDNHDTKPPEPFKHALAYNAELATELRKIGARLWG